MSDLREPRPPMDLHERAAMRQALVHMDVHQREIILPTPTVLPGVTVRTAPPWLDRLGGLITARFTPMDERSR